MEPGSLRGGFLLPGGAFACHYKFLAAGVKVPGMSNVFTHTKLLGIIAMIASPMMLVEFILRYTVGLPGGEFGKFEAVLGLVYLLGFLSSALGLRLLRVTGRGTTGGVLFSIQVVGVLLAAGQNILQLSGHPDLKSTLFQIGDVAWPLSHVFLLVIGAAVLMAKVWAGWQRFVPLLCGLALPLAMGLGTFGGEKAFGLAFAVFTTTFFGLLGYAIATARL